MPRQPRTRQQRQAATAGAVLVDSLLLLLLGTVEHIDLIQAIGAFGAVALITAGFVTAVTRPTGKVTA